MRWQYSILGLLGIMALVAICLTFAKYFPTVAYTVFVGGGIWALFLLLANALLTRTQSPNWMLISHLAWMFVGTLFLLITLMVFQNRHGLVLTDNATGLVAAFMAGGAVVCYLGALRSFALWVQARRKAGKEAPGDVDKSAR